MTSLTLVAFFFRGKECGRRYLSQAGIEQAIYCATHEKATDCDISLVEIVKKKNNKEEHICIFNRIPHLNSLAIKQAQKQPIESLDDLKNRLSRKQVKNLL